MGVVKAPVRLVSLSLRPSLASISSKHNCALFAPAYEQPQKADCQMWCDPRNGSAKAFQRGLEDLGDLSGHPELSQLPWALWGHSGGGHWAGGMTLLFPERQLLRGYVLEFHF